MATTFSEINNSETPTLVDFFCRMVRPCKMMKPTLKELKSKIGDNAKIIKIDVDKNQDTIYIFEPTVQNSTNLKSEDGC